MKKELEVPISHSPKINRSIVINKDNQSNVFNRLYSSKKLNNSSENIYLKKENFSFQPKVYSIIINENDFSGNVNSFLNRLEKYNHKKTEKYENLKQYYEDIENSKCPFRPNISHTDNSDYSIKIAARRDDEKTIDRLVRISGNGYHKKHSLQKLFWANDECTFCPKINKNYKKIRNSYSSTTGCQLVCDKEEKKNFSKNNLDKSSFNFSYILNQDDSNLNYYNNINEFSDFSFTKKKKPYRVIRRQFKQKKLNNSLFPNQRENNKTSNKHIIKKLLYQM